MYLIQCKCGCHFTVKALKADRHFRCQECGKAAAFSPIDDYSAAMSKLESAGFAVSRVPDDAKITVTFQA